MRHTRDIIKLHTGAQQFSSAAVLEYKIVLWTCEFYKQTQLHNQGFMIN